MQTFRPIVPLAAIRRSPALVVWGLAVFFAGVVLLPMLHAVDHRVDDHVHGSHALAHALAHATGADHPERNAGDGHAHGAGALEHYGLAWLETAAPILHVPVAPRVELARAAPAPVWVERYQLHPIRSQAP